MILTCPFCKTELNVGNETRSIVALCSRANKTCDLHQWGSAKTRVHCVADDDKRDENGDVVPTHALQTDPPLTAAELQVEKAAELLDLVGETYVGHADP